jgi:uncharacterized protein (UPF0262 family)
MSEDKERARAEMETLEAQLVEAKESGDAPMELKLALREARQRFRTLRDADPDPVGPGDATVQAGVN